MNSDKIREALHFQDLTPEEKERRGILCRLYGPCADIEAPTRNGRKYNDDLWEKVFEKNELVNELLENGGIPGEAQHPTDRDEIDVEKIAIMMPEKPKRDSEGHLIAYYDVQDTPSGRIVYQLARYGFKLGISSRGTGEVYTDENGEEIVDPEVYDFKCFDTVIIPSVKAARMNMVESLDTKKGFKQALQESLNSATPGDRKIMEETLDSLGIKLDENINTSNSDNINESSSKKVDNESKEVSDTKSNKLIDNLTETLKSKVLLETKVQSLQEQLAVSDTKAKQLEEELAKYKKLSSNLSRQVVASKDLKDENQRLKEQLEEKDTKIDKQNQEISKLMESIKESRGLRMSLKESIDSKTSTINSLNAKVKTMTNSYTAEIEKLKEEFEDYKADSELKSKNALKQIANSKALVEKYETYVRKVVDRYIQNSAIRLGVTANEIKNRLNESYTLEDIDKVCEQLTDYNTRMGQLPFSVTPKTRVRVSEVKPTKKSTDTYDDLADLKELAGL